MLVDDYYERYFEQFTVEKCERYFQSLEESIGHKYSFSATPFLLPKDQFDRLVNITNSIVRLLKSPSYQEQVIQTPWFLPQNPMQPHDYFGDVEFHITHDGEKLIEVNFNPPGHVGFLEILEEKFLEAFDFPCVLRANEGFEQALVETVSDHYRYKKIAISVNHTAASVPYYPHYKYIEKVFSKYGVESKVVYATDVEFDDKAYPVWDGQRYDRIFNLLIVRVWEDNPDLFSRYGQAYEKHPEMFFLNPLGWKLGNKSMLVSCYNIKNKPFGLNEQDQENIGKVSLKTHLLSEFDAPEQVLEEFGGEKNIVLKPLDNYHVKGVAIQPSVERLNQIFDSGADRYVVQQFFSPGEIPCISIDGAIKPYLFSLRMGFLNGRFFGMRGYNFTKPPSVEEITPVIVI